MMRNRPLNNKLIIVLSFALTFCLGLLLSKSYAVYKLEEQYDVIKQKIDGYTPGDLQIAAIVDGEETDEFPTYETNYKVISVECTNGAHGVFDVTNWRIAVDDMSSTSTKCTVSFDSTKKNEIEPINMTKEELIALNEEITSTSVKQLANYLYPVGSIYISTEDDSPDKVKEKFGGTWVRYATDTTLVGYKDDSTKEVNSTGGQNSVVLTNSNLPNHVHTTSATSTGTESANHTHGFSGSTANTTSSWSVGYVPYNGGGGAYTSVAYSLSGDLYGSGGYQMWHGTYYNTHAHSFSGTTGGVSANHTHTVPALTTTSCTDCNADSVDIQNPYTVVYMYKRTA